MIGCLTLHRVRRKSLPEVGGALVINHEYQQIGPFRPLRIPDEVGHGPIGVITLLVHDAAAAAVNFQHAVARDIEHVVNSVGVGQGLLHYDLSPERPGGIAQLGTDGPAHAHKITGISGSGAAAEMRSALETQHHFRVMGITAAAEDHRPAGPEFLDFLSGQNLQADHFPRLIANNFSDLMIGQQFGPIVQGPGSQLTHQFSAITQLALPVAGIQGSAPYALVLRQVIHIIDLELTGPVYLLDGIEGADGDQEIHHFPGPVVKGIDKLEFVLGQSQARSVVIIKVRK